MKICLVFNHLSCSDGVARSAIGVANLLCKKHQVTLIPIFRCEKDAVNQLLPEVIVKPIFRRYFSGMSRLLALFPKSFLYKIIVTDEYDIEVTFQYGLATKVIAASNNKNARKYCWMHGYDEGLLYKKYYLKMDKLFCVSKCNAERLYKELGNRKIVEYCYNPIDDNKVRNQGKAKIELQKPDEFLFVSVGRHSPEKGYMRLLECVKKLKDNGYRFFVWLVGDGPEHSELVKKVSDLKLKEYVVLVGAKTNPHAYTSKGDCFICSSFSEGYSTACTEAIMLGVPVLSTCVSGAKEIIKDADAGLVVDLDDQALYEGMKYILDNPQIVSEWKKRLEHTKDKFSYKIREEKLLEIFS